MPALPNVPKVLKLTLHSTLQDDLNVMNRVYIEYSGSAPDNGQLDTLCGVAATSWGTHMLPNISPNGVQTQIEAVDLTTTSSATGSATGAGAGTRSGPTLTAAPSIVLNGLIARRYRGGKPKMFLWAGVETDIQTVGTWKSSFATAVAGAYNAWVGDVTAAAWSGGGTLAEVNVSYYEGFTVVTNPVTGRARNVPTVRVTPLVDEITARVALIRIGSQRRRNQ